MPMGIILLQVLDYYFKKNVNDIHIDCKYNYFFKLEQVDYRRLQFLVKVIQKRDPVPRNHIKAMILKVDILKIQMITEMEEENFQILIIKLLQIGLIHP